MKSNDPNSYPDLGFLLEEAPVGIGLVDFNGTFLYVNGPYCRFLGYSKDELIGTSFLDITSEKDKQHGLDRMNLMNKQGVLPITFNKKYIHKKGHEIEVTITGKTIEDDGALALLVSVQENKATSNKLTGQFEEIINESTIAMFDVVGRAIRTWNRGAFEIFGYYPDEIVGLDIDQLIPETARVQFDASYKSILQSKKVVTPEAIRIAKDGDFRTLHENLFPLYNDNHELVGFTVMAYDISAKIMLREELQHNISTIDSLMHTTSNVIVGVNQEFNIEYINQVRKGFQIADVIGSNVLEWIAPKDKDRYKECLEKTFEGKPQTLELESFGNDMQPAFYSIRLNPIRKSDGVIHTVLAQATDITEFRRSATKLEESKKRYSAVFEQTYQAIYFFDRQTKCVVDHNKAFAEILGCPGKDLTGTSIYDFIYHAKNDVDEAVQKIVAQKNIGIGERQWKTESGKILDMLILGSHIHLPNHQLIAIVSQDITALKSSQIEANQLAGIVKHSSDAIIVLDTNGFSKVWNQKALDLFGFTREEIQGKSILHLTPDDKVHESKQLLKNLAKGKSNNNLNTVRIDKAGNRIAVILTCFPILNDLNEVETFAAIIRDIRPELDQRQKVMRALFQGEETERKRIAQGLHDGLGQQLSALSLCMSLIQEDVEPEMFQRISMLAEGCIQEYRAVTHNLIPPALRSKGIIEAIQQVTENLEQSSDLSISIESPTMINADVNVQTELFRIFQELLNNTMKHADASNISIKLEEETDKITMTYKDDGRGFDSNKKSDSGLGLGNIGTRVEIFEGNFEINSQPGKGVDAIVSIKLVS